MTANADSMEAVGAVRDRCKDGKGRAMNATLFEMAVASERRVIDIENARRVKRGELDHLVSGRKGSAVSRAFGAVKSGLIGGRDGE